MDTLRLLLLALVLIFLFASPDVQRSSLAQKQELDSFLGQERQALHILNTTLYDAFDPTAGKWINITGFRQSDGYAWSLLPKVKERAHEHLHAIFGGSSWMEAQSPLRLSADLVGKSQQIEHLNVTSVRDISWNDQNHLYQNVTGFVKGLWVRSSIADAYKPPLLNITAVAPHAIYSTSEHKRNITGLEGHVWINLKEKSSELSGSHGGSIREIRADMTIKDETSSGDGWEFKLHGVHYPRHGGIILVTTGRRFAGIFGLPHFALTEQKFSLAQKLLNETLRDTVLRQEAGSDAALLNPWSSSPSGSSENLSPAPHCEFIVYLQQHPVSRTITHLAMIEEELRFPTGASFATAPPLRMSAVMFSPDCGFVLESKGPPEFAPQQGTHLTGLKLEVYMHSARRGIIAFGILICAEVFLLKRQMVDASTPSTRSRISFYTIAMMGLGDGFVCMAFMFASTYVDGFFLPLIATAFVAFLGVSFFGMRFMMEIWTVQAPERLERTRRASPANPVPQAPPQPAPEAAAVITAAGADTLPLPVTTARPIDEPVILPPDQDLGATETEDAAAAPAALPATNQPTVGSTRRETNALYSRFYFLLLVIVFLSLHATSWPTTPRSIYTNCLALTYLSFWVPQIYRNIMRNCRRALRWDFVVGQSLLRLAPFLYFYTVEDNLLFTEVDYSAAYALAAWVWIQVWALVSQEVLGPRFFVPAGWAPPAYDYHPLLREDADPESGPSMPIGFSTHTITPMAVEQSSSSSSSNTSTHNDDRPRGNHTFDCAICMQLLEVPILPPSVAGGLTDPDAAGMIFARRAYMVTPCRHIFHSACLQGWMRYRLQCPICRESLPPV